MVTIPRSYRKPHMVVADGLNELWIRHDRQKSRMAIAEIRAAVTSTEDLAMRAERFIEQRAVRLIPSQVSPPLRPQLLLMGTPILMEEGRVDIRDSSVEDLLKRPPSYRGRGSMLLSDPSAMIRFTVNGRRAMLADISRLETSPLT